MSKYKSIEIKDFVGLTFKDVKTSTDNEELTFETHDGRKFKMYHEQDCCESVSIEDICGELDFLVGVPILEAEEVTKEDENAPESGTWTFYHINTAKGYVTLRWYGESNGYYSESVDIIEYID